MWSAFRFQPAAGASMLWLAALLALPPSSPAQISTRSKAWSRSLGGPGDSTAAVATNGTIYVGSFKGKLWAFNPDGSCQWFFKAGREIRSSPAIGSDGTIFFGCRDRKLYAVSPQGKRKWTFQTGGWVDSSPALAVDGTIYFGSWDCRLYALAPDGSLKWQFQTAGPIVSSPAIGAQGTVYFGSHDGKFYALSPAGACEWQSATGGPIISSPAVDQDGNLYFTSVDGCLYSLNAAAALRWRLKTGGITDSSPVIGADGTIYVGVNTNLWAVGPTGQKKWDQPHVQLVEATPLTLADNSVCFLTHYGLLMNYDAEHRQQWTFYMPQHGHASPVVGPNGTICLGYWFFWAIEAKARLAPSAWPKFRGDPQNTGRVQSVHP